MPTSREKKILGRDRIKAVDHRKRARGRTPRAAGGAGRRTAGASRRVCGEQAPAAGARWRGRRGDVDGVAAVRGQRPGARAADGRGGEDRGVEDIFTGLAQPPAIITNLGRPFSLVPARRELEFRPRPEFREIRSAIPTPVEFAKFREIRTGGPVAHIFRRASSRSPARDVHFGLESAKRH